ncbi:MAG: NAD-dependent epimerase/dehydratase family protein [Candidatus Bathyarchaeia archaeon]
MNPSVRTVLADLSQHGAWEDEFRTGNFVVQLQAQIASTKSVDFVANNIHSVRNVITACQRHGIRHLIHVSSSVVISNSNDHNTLTKRTAERLVKESQLPYTILRPPLLYGCFDVKHLGWLTKFLEKFPAFPVPGNGRFLRQPLYVMDLCGVILACIKRDPTNKIYNVIGLEKIDYVDLIRTISREKGLRRLFLSLPFPLFRFSLNLYGFLVNKPTFTTAQMTALTAGDVFPIEPWCDIFGVKYTTFLEGITKTLNSPYYKYRDRMISTY